MVYILIAGVDVLDILPVECWEKVIGHVVQESVHTNWSVGQLCGVSRGMRDLVLNTMGRECKLVDFVAGERFLGNIIPAFWLYEDRIGLYRDDVEIIADEVRDNLVVGVRMVKGPNVRKYNVEFQVFVKVSKWRFRFWFVWMVMVIFLCC